ncbi:MAG: hypothetical protein SXQ77_13615 [Halobacteria archaeon]|nr:hypothetical protein [Halobacteria archaeon]
MTGNASSSGTNWIAKQQFYRRLMFGLLLAGVTGFIVADYFNRPIIGVAVYWAGIAGYLGVWKGTPVKIFDERDCSLERRASTLTLTVSALALITLAPAEIVLSEMGIYTAPPAFEGVIYTVSAQGLLFGVIYLWLRYR